jgi:formiminoglutamase
MHTPPDMSLWTGRDDTELEGPDATRIHQCIKPWTEDSPSGVCLLGFACDEGVRRNHGRVGAAEGPVALRKAMANLSWAHDAPIMEVGDVSCNNGDLEGAQRGLGESVGSLLKTHQRPVILGGGHETAWGSFLGLVETHPDAAIGIVNIDAHFDLRPGVASSGTPFRQMADWCRAHAKPFKYWCLGIAGTSNTPAAFRAASELGIAWEYDRATSPSNLDELAPKLSRFVRESDFIYLSVDFDVLPGSVMPAVSAPAGLGVPLEMVEDIIVWFAASEMLAVADFVEFNPAHDRAGLAAKTAARLVWTLARTWKEAPR